jgi:hypothetical protein
VHNITEGPIEQVRFQGVEELGFAAGYLVSLSKPITLSS